jgi:hypothetical protein
MKKMVSQSLLTNLVNFAPLRLGELPALRGAQVLVRHRAGGSRALRDLGAGDGARDVARMPRVSSPQGGFGGLYTWEG